MSEDSPGPAAQDHAPPATEPERSEAPASLDPDQLNAALELGFDDAEGFEDDFDPAWFGPGAASPDSGAASTTDSERASGAGHQPSLFDALTVDGPTSFARRHKDPAVPEAPQGDLFAGADINAELDDFAGAGFMTGGAETSSACELPSFEPEQLEEALQHHFGFPAFREGQREAIRAVLEGRDVLAIMPTSAGKSLLYQLPALMLPGVTLVISPLISLMKDQVDKLREKNLPAALINSTLSEAERRDVMDAARRGEIKMLFVAPERFRSRHFCRTIANLQVSLFAVDEAHCVSTWGHDFRPDYRKLTRAIEMVGRPPVLAVTATATENVRGDILEFLGIREDHFCNIAGFDRPNLRFGVRQVANDHEKAAIIKSIAARVDGPGIVYCSTRKSTEKVADRLREAGLEVQAYHAGFSSDERRSIQEAFMDGQIRIVCATNAFGLGIDKQNVRFVIHHDLPGSVEAYYQEAGRAGRDGEPSECLLLFRAGDIYIQEFMIDTNYPSKEIVESVYRQLVKLDTGAHEITLNELKSRVREARSPRTISAALMLLSDADHIDRGGRLDNPAHLRRLAAPKKGSRAAAQKLLHQLGKSFGDRLDEGVSMPLPELAGATGTSVSELRKLLPQLRDGGYLDYRAPFTGRALTVLYPRVRPHEVKVDYSDVHERHRRDRERLNRIIRFAYGGRCRRAAILDYFGAPFEESCSNCDICDPRDPSAKTRKLSQEELITLKKVLSCVARMQGRFGRNRVIQVLRGSRAKAVLDAGLDELSTYGLLKTMDRDDIGRILQECMKHGLCEELRDAMGRYPKIALTELGRDVMQDRARIDLAMPDPSARSSASERPAPVDLDVDGGNLFEALRRLRRELAKKRRVKPYMVFPDRTLRAIAKKRPKTKEAFATIKGVGPSKTHQYAKALTSFIQEWELSSAEASSESSDS